MKFNIPHLLLRLYLKIVPCYKGRLQLAGNLVKIIIKQCDLFFLSGSPVTQ